MYVNQKTVKSDAYLEPSRTPTTKIFYENT